MKRHEWIRLKGKGRNRGRVWHLPSIGDEKTQCGKPFPLMSGQIVAVTLVAGIPSPACVQCAHSLSIPKEERIYAV
jgi:hypothetical protein